MSGKSPPLRPAADPQVLAAQLKQALADLAGQGARYQGYLAQIVRSCFLAIHDGDLESPQASLDLLAPALHIGERLAGSSDAIEAAAWVRATARFFEVAKEALAPRLTIDTLLQREHSDTEREILQILLRADKTALRRGEIASRWSAPHPPPTTMRIGQILASFHEDGLVVRVKQAARGGSDVAFYRLSRLGRELCEKLGLQSSAPSYSIPVEAPGMGHRRALPHDLRNIALSAAHLNYARVAVPALRGGTAIDANAVLSAPRRVTPMQALTSLPENYELLSPRRPGAPARKVA
jgi:DNA-binding PadR family transcriptional regulator